MSAPQQRTVYGLQEYDNPETRFSHTRVETRDFGTKPMVYCTVTCDGIVYPLIFGWLDDAESALSGESVNVRTMTPAEKTKLRRHFQSSGLPHPLANAHFW